MDDTHRCRTEIEELHACFQAWFRGEAKASLSRCEEALAADFEIVAPDGRRRARTELMEALAQTRGAHAGEAFSIDVRAVRVSAAGGGVFIARYEEWHEQDASSRGRISTAVMHNASGRPRGLEWLAVHETWLEGCDSVAGG